MSIINRTRMNENGEYWCPTCKIYLPKNKFHKSKNQKYGIDTYCAKCANERKSKKRHAPIKKRNIKLESLDRGNIKNFTYYFSQRQYFFKETFKMKFSPEAAKEAFAAIFVT